MKHLLPISKVILFLSISGFFIQLIFSLRNIEQFSKEQIIGIRSDVNVHIGQMLGEIVETRKLVDRRLVSLEKKSVNLIRESRDETLQRIDLVRNDLLPVRDNINNTLVAYTKIPNTFDSNIKEFVDCGNNALCVQNQLLDTLFAIRTTSRDIAFGSEQMSQNMLSITSSIAASSNTFQEEFPKIAKNVEGITSNINRITKPKWYDRVFGYAVNSSLLYFNINRAAR